jgi:hypothetical protein
MIYLVMSAATVLNSIAIVYLAKTVKIHSRRIEARPTEWSVNNKIRNAGACTRKR